MAMVMALSPSVRMSVHSRLRLVPASVASSSFTRLRMTERLRPSVFFMLLPSSASAT